MYWISNGYIFFPFRLRFHPINTHTTWFISDVYFFFIYLFTFLLCAREIAFGLCSFARVIIIGRFITIYFHRPYYYYNNRIITLDRYCPEGSSRNIRTRENRLYKNLTRSHMGVKKYNYSVPCTYYTA